MEEMWKIGVGIIVLIFGYFIGNFLAKMTKEELGEGREWFKLIIWVSLIGGFVGLILGDDVLMFSMFFIAIVTSRSIRK